MDRLRDCVEEMVKFTLDHRADFDLVLNDDFCSGLLADDLVLPAGDQNESRLIHTLEEAIVAGVLPEYPLYKRPALGLLKSIDSGSFFGNFDKIPNVKDVIWLKQREDEWSKLIFQMGSELVNALKDITCELQVQEPLFSLLKGMEMSRKLYNMDQEKINGVVAIHLTKSVSQPCAALAHILSGLSYGGVQSLLGLSHTIGSSVDALPPPRLILLSSFMLPYKPKVKGCRLSHGARALAKHVDRSSDGFWGVLHGNDSEKNRIAVDIINRFVSHCCWMNIHMVPPHGEVFEIRVAQGYGARWSRDGTRFIGFLEPYNEDGHSMAWKH